MHRRAPGALAAARHQRHQGLTSGTIINTRPSYLRLGLQLHRLIHHVSRVGRVGGQHLSQPRAARVLLAAAPAAALCSLGLGPGIVVARSRRGDGAGKAVDAALQ
jgi:hypothetical protein